MLLADSGFKRIPPRKACANFSRSAAVERSAPAANGMG
jgi:hypothetical protein